VSADLEADEAGLLRDRSDTTVRFKTVSNDGKVHYTPAIAKYRCVVERVFGALKKWQVFSAKVTTSKAKTIKLEDIVIGLSGICNYLLIQNDKGW
jgi:hypothetical protein